MKFTFIVSVDGWDNKEYEYTTISVCAFTDVIDAVDKIKSLLGYRGPETRVISMYSAELESGKLTLVSRNETHPEVGNLD